MKFLQKLYINQILTNPVYIGKIRYSVRQNWSEKRRSNINANPIITDGIHEGIIDEKLWDRVHAILISKQDRPARVHSIVKNVNNERVRKVNPAKKDLVKIDNELEKLDKKRTKLFEAYEDEIITKEELRERKNELIN